MGHLIYSISGQINFEVIKYRKLQLKQSSSPIFVIV